MLETIFYHFDKYKNIYVSKILTEKAFFTSNFENIKHVFIIYFTDFDNLTIQTHFF